MTARTGLLADVGALNGRNIGYLIYITAKLQLQEHVRFSRRAGSGGLAGDLASTESMAMDYFPVPNEKITLSLFDTSTTGQLGTMRIIVKGQG